MARKTRRPPSSSSSSAASSPSRKSESSSYSDESDGSCSESDTELARQQTKSRRSNVVPVKSATKTVEKKEIVPKPAASNIPKILHKKDSIQDEIDEEELEAELERMDSQTEEGRRRKRTEAQRLETLKYFPRPLSPYRPSANPYNYNPAVEVGEDEAQRTEKKTTQEDEEQKNDTTDISNKEDSEDEEDDDDNPRKKKTPKRKPAGKSRITKFQCDECSEVFPTKSKLTRHKQSHTNNGGAVCRYCNAVMKYKYNLKHHMTKCQQKMREKNENETIVNRFPEFAMACSDAAKNPLLPLPALPRGFYIDRNGVVTGDDWTLDCSLDALIKQYRLQTYPEQSTVVEKRENITSTSKTEPKVRGRRTNKTNEANNGGGIEPQISRRNLRQRESSFD